MPQFVVRVKPRNRLPANDNRRPGRKSLTYCLGLAFGIAYGVLMYGVVAYSFWLMFAS